MDFVFGTQCTWKQMGLNDKNVTRPHGQLNKKPLELDNEEEVPINVDPHDRYISHKIQELI